MPIQILPARLANQIAAGEVVERPASVIKEIVENSLDAGATRIDITIEKGGHKLMRVRDNGCGINRDELTLALSRHATSKVAHVDDLESIMSLGFRGEALASISSVARLTLDSRPKDQNEAWQAYAEGRDMQVVVKPTAHPIGTTIEVVDLFFNTPARRKFLRTEKTEFSHIDELIRRIALSRFDVSITLTHNGKQVRNYRAAKSNEEYNKRIAQICGQAFLSDSIQLDIDLEGMRLWGWMVSPFACGKQSDNQYSYVNGRMMRDKLINHAIRQAYDSTLMPEQQPHFVLFLEIEPNQVDVNVHPAKHEVRFHQSRLVHDFIFQAVYKSLHDTNTLLPQELSEQPSSQNTVAASSSQPTYADYPKTQLAEAQSNGLSAGHGVGASVDDGTMQVSEASRQYQSQSLSQSQPQRMSEGGGDRYLSNPTAKPTVLELNAYTQLLSPQTAEKSTHKVPDKNWSWLAFKAGKYVLLEYKNSFWWLDLTPLRLLSNQNINDEAAIENVKTVPLLLPIRVSLESTLDTYKNKLTVLNESGFEVDVHNKHIIVRKVPIVIRDSDIVSLVGEFLQLSVNLSGKLQVLAWFANQAQSTMSESMAQSLLNEHIAKSDEDTIFKQYGTCISQEELINRLVTETNK